MKKTLVKKHSILDNGFLKGFYQPHEFNFSLKITELLLEKGFLKEMVPLENLHLHIQQEYQVAKTFIFNKIAEAFYEKDDFFYVLYLKLVKYISQQILDFDFVFQETPDVRFHFPVPLAEKYRLKDGLYSAYHIDSMYGCPIEAINCWIPLTNCYATNSLMLSSFDDSIKALMQLCEDINLELDNFYDLNRDLFYQKLFSDTIFQLFIINSCKPIETKPGEIIFFDSRCIHGPTENKELHTRVSLDFRIIPLHIYEKMRYYYASSGQNHSILSKNRNANSVPPPIVWVTIPDDAILE